VRWLLAIVTAHQATAPTFDQGLPFLTPYLQQMPGLSLGFAAVVATVGNLERAIGSGGLQKPLLTARPAGRDLSRSVAKGLTSSL